MSNIVIDPSSGIIEFNTGSANGDSFDNSLSGASRLEFKNSGQLSLTSYATGVSEKFTVDGSNGRLFTVDNEVIGSIFSVNDAAGLPIVEVFSDDKVVIGEYASDALVISGSSVQVTGSNVVTEGHLSDENYVTSDEILTHLLTVDGANSNLDADKLDGQQGSYYLDYSNFSSTPAVNDVSETNLLNRLAALDSSDTIYIGDAGDDTTVVVRGTLQVDGSTTTINSNTLSIGDNQIVLNNDVTGTPTQNAGIIVERGTATNSSLIWDEANDYWKAGLAGSEVQLALTNGTYSGLRAQSTTKGDVGLGNVTNESKATMFASPSFTGDVVITDDTFPFIRSVTNGSDAGIKFSSNSSGGSYGQQGTLSFNHVDTSSYGSAASFKLATSEATLTILADGKLMYGEGIYSKPTSGTGAGTRKDTNWDTAYTDRNKWDGGSTGLNASTGRTSLGLGSAATSNTGDFAPAAGSTSIVSLGTVVEGDWNAGVISSTYLDADTAHLSGTQTFSGAKTFSSGLNISVSTSNTQLKLKRTGTATGEFNIYTNNDTLFFNNVGQASFPMVIDEDGNVGIGTTSPSTRLQVASPTATSVVLATSYSPTNTNNFFEAGIVANDGYLTLRNSGVVSTVHIDSDGDSYFNGGNVGIGTTSFVDTRAAGGLHLANAKGIAFQATSSNTNSRAWRIRNDDLADWGSLNFAVGTTNSDFADAATDVVMTMLRSGNVGIGTTSPAVDLEIKTATNSSSSEEGLRLYNAGGGIGAGVRIGLGVGTTYSEKGHIRTDIVNGGAGRLFLGSNGSDRLVINENGKVLVNGAEDNSGKADFAVSGGTVLAFRNNQVQMGGSDMNWNSKIFDDGQAKWSAWDRNIEISSTGSNTGSATARDIIFSPQTSGTAASTERMRIKGDGNVGIGTTNPSTKLQISSTMSSTPTSNIFLDVGGATNIDGGGGSIVFGTSLSGSLTQYNAKITGTRASGGSGGDSSLGFWTTLASSSISPQERMTITKEGNVGIGTTSPDAKLHVVANNSPAQLYLQRTGSITGNYRIGVAGATNRFYITDIAQSQDRLVINESGNVGIGNTNPTAAKLIVRKDDGYAFRTENASGYTFRIAGDTGNIEAAGDLTVSGDLTVNGTTSTINSTTLQVDDKNIELGTVATPTDTTADGGGITLKGATDKTINWVNSTGAWTFSEDVVVSGDITTGGTNATVKADRFSGIGSGVVVGTNSNGTVFLRPAGVGSTTSQSTFTGTLATIGTNATFAGDATVSGDLTVSTDFQAGAAVNFSALANAGSDVDKFLVSDSGDVKFRTGAEVLSDIGGITDVGGKITKKISGDGAATTFTVTHSFGTPHVMTQLLHYGNNGTGATYEVVQASVKRNSDNAIDVVFGVAPTSSEDYLALITKMPAIS